MEWDPASVSHADAVARLFPDLPRDIRMESGVPGRSWPVDGAPAVLSLLDRQIVDLTGGRIASKKLKSPEILAAGGITSVLYAARVHTLIAWNNANVNVRSLSPERVERLENERRAFERRIGSTHAILACDPSWAARSGNPYLNPINPAQEAIDLEAGQALYAALPAEMARDQKRLELITEELKRIERDNSEKLWDVSFFLSMGNLWKLLTGKLPPHNPGGPFTKLLNAAICTISGDRYTAPPLWGVGSKLLERFEGSAPGEGFRIGETGEFSLECIHQVASRGPDVRVFLETAKEDLGAMAAMMVALRDHSDQPDEIILREMVLRPFLGFHGALPSIVRAQIGWLYKVDAKGIKAAARGAIEAARDGDDRAIAAVELAHRSQKRAMTRQSEWGERYDIAWPKPFGGRDPLDVRTRLEARADDPLSCALLDWPLLWHGGSRLPRALATR